MAEQTISQNGYPDSKSGLTPGQGMLVVTEGPDKESAIIVEGPVITIGTRPDNSLQLTDKTVSRHHAEIVAHAGHYIIRDLGSTNGTIVNGQRIREEVLEIGAVITLGYTQLIYAPCAPQPASASAPGQIWGGVCGCSPQMRALFRLLDQIAPTDATIILKGETGTGKEVLARAVHEKSLRAGGPFVVFDCRAIADSLVERELLGYEKGAFPGASGDRAGVFEQAQGGTLFLDEIGELDLETQPKLLRVLEKREVRRMGAAASIALDVRIIASSGIDLDGLVAAGRFRKDLFYRLAVDSITIPPLRERREDIPLLAAELLKALAPEYKLHTPPRLADETIEILMAHDWPGNVRELRNVLSRALSLGCRTVLRPEDLLAHSETGRGRQAKKNDMSYEQIEKIAIEQALLRRDGDMQKSAKALGLPRKELLEKVKKYGLT
jgi:DNA-binding NtrC family response regulator